jgi:hypothetical protein
MAQLIPLAIASAFWPILLAVVIVSLRAPNPGRLLASFLAGGLLTTVTVGFVVVKALDGTTVATSSSSASPTVDLVVGALALLAALVLARRPPKPEPPPPPTSAQRGDSGRLERMLARGAPLAFVAGIVLNIIPGAFPLIALKDIAQLGYSTAGTLAVLLGFYVIMFAFIEIPLVGYLVAPARTAAATVRFNAWLDRNLRRLAVGGLALGGAYAVIHGLVGLLT